MENTSPVLIVLTDREKEVLQLIFDGNSTRQTAVLLYCSKRTIDFHLAKIYEKLQVSNRVQALRRVVQLGLLAF
jgi:DNA-binding CsgD family transcriptional regulator